MGVHLLIISLTTMHTFQTYYIDKNAKRLYGNHSSVTVEPAFVKKYMETLANRGFYRKNWTPASILIVSKLVSSYGAPAGTRTPDTLLKRQVLYLLSYWGVWLGWRDSNPLYRSQSPVCYHYTTSQYHGNTSLVKTG